MHIPRTRRAAIESLELRTMLAVDLAIEWISAEPEVAFANEQSQGIYDLGVLVKNVGTTTLTSPVAAGFVLSTDAVLGNADDRYGGRLTADIDDTIAPGESVTHQTTAQWNGGLTPAGRYYVGVVLEGQSAGDANSANDSKLSEGAVLDIVNDALPAGGVFDGTSGEDVIDVYVSSWFDLIVTINGVSRGARAQDLDAITLNGGGGNDTFHIGHRVNYQQDGGLQVNGGDGNDTIDFSQSLAFGRTAALGGRPAGFLDSIDVIGAGVETLIGTSGPDRFMGSDIDEVFFGRGGDDVLIGGAGDDVLIGEDGVDRFYGGDGDDTLVGGEGNDTLGGNAGRDRIFGGGGRDRLNGHGGHDRLFGESENDRLYGYEGNDYLDGGSSRDRLYGHGGTDTFFGSGGNDSLFSRDGIAEQLEGGRDTDTAAADAEDLLSGIEVTG